MPAGKGKGKTRGGGGGGAGGGGGGGGGGGTSSKDSNRQSRSRNTTPASTAMSENNLMSGELSLSSQLSYDDILHKYVTAGDTSIPASVTLNELASDLKALSSSAARQAAACRTRIAELTEQVQKKQVEERERKEREDEEKEKLERKRRDREERRAREGEDGVKRKKKDKDKDKHSHGHTSKHPPTHGAHQVASQAPDSMSDDRKNKKRKTHSPEEDTKGKQRSRSPSMDSSSSESDRQPSPLPPAIVYDYFENDDTIYHIEEVTPETSVEDRRRIYQVADFPKMDLTDLQAGDPPDMDFTNAKPQNQVTHVAFAAYLEPYFRNFTEEDLAFLRERGDRVGCYVIPPLGPHYSETWAQDEAQTIASSAPPQLTSGPGPKGDPADLNDEMLEKEDVTVGPLLSRILAAMVVEDGACETQEGTNGDANNDDKKDQSSASALPGHQDPSWKSANGKANYSSIEEAMKRELMYFGLCQPNEPEPNWDEQQDDEISARLRALQAELRKQSLLNGARKARLTDLLKDHLAHQEYQTILEDLDKQVEQAYTKRTRSIKPKKKKAVPNGAGIAQSKMGIGDQARVLMERRKRWKETIGAVFDKDMTRIPIESIFNDLAELERIEQMGGLDEDA